jgi:hypothetical protein
MAVVFWLQTGHLPCSAFFCTKTSPETSRARDVWILASVEPSMNSGNQTISRSNSVAKIPEKMCRNTNE